MPDKSNADIYPFTPNPEWKPLTLTAQQRLYDQTKDDPNCNQWRQEAYEKVHGKGAWYNKAENVTTPLSRDDLSPSATRYVAIASEDQVNAVKAELAAYRRHADALTNLLFCLLLFSAMLNIVSGVIIYWIATQ